jgi:hypothetical protein
MILIFITNPPLSNFIDEMKRKVRYVHINKINYIFYYNNFLSAPPT